MQVIVIVKQCFMARKDNNVLKTKHKINIANVCISIPLLNLFLFNVLRIK